MQLQVTGRNVELSDSIRTYAEKKLGKLEKQLRDGTPVELHLSAEKNPSIAADHVAEATVRLKGNVLHARAAAPDMKAAIDELSAKLVRQVKQAREKRTSIFKRSARVE
jgi:putative sigma-54 modulation protein